MLVATAQFIHRIVWDNWHLSFMSPFATYSSRCSVHLHTTQQPSITKPMTKKEVNSQHSHNTRRVESSKPFCRWCPNRDGIHQQKTYNPARLAIREFWNVMEIVFSIHSMINKWYSQPAISWQRNIRLRQMSANTNASHWSVLFDQKAWQVRTQHTINRFDHPHHNYHPLCSSMP